MEEKRIGKEIRKLWQCSGMFGIILMWGAMKVVPYESEFVEEKENVFNMR